MRRRAGRENSSRRCSGPRLSAGAGLRGAPQIARSRRERRRLPGDELPAPRRARPGVEEEKLQRLRLAADLRFDLRAAGDQRRVAEETYLLLAALRALVL